MKYVSIKTGLLIFLVFIGYISLFYSSGPTTNGGDRTGSPVSAGTCSSCHAPAGNFTPIVSIKLLDPGNNPVSVYAPNTVYTVRISQSSATGLTSNTRYGFQVVALQTSTNNGINNWGVLPLTLQSVTINGRTYIEHNFQLINNVVDIPWTSPATNMGNITFYCSGNIVNNNFHESGDNSASSSWSITPMGFNSCMLPALSLVIDHVLCKGHNTGIVSVGTSGGTAPFSFAWFGPNGYQSIQQNISNLYAGNYSVMVTATGGCSTSTSAVVTEPSTSIQLSATSNGPVCEGDSLVLTGMGNGGTGNLAYHWLNPLAQMINAQHIHIDPVFLSDSGVYTFFAVDGNNCLMSDSISVAVDPLPAIDSVVITVVTPLNYSFSVSNPQTIDNYLWSFGDGASDTTSNPFHAYDTGGVYTLRLIIVNPCGTDTFYRQINAVGTGVDKVFENEILIYPNPAQEEINVKFLPMYLDDVCVRLVNSIGIVAHRSFLKFSKGALSIGIPSLPAGVYALVISRSNGILIKRQIIVLK